jgi:hypothetical protein
MYKTGYDDDETMGNQKPRPSPSPTNKLLILGLGPVVVLLFFVGERLIVDS